jgi:hypothetical protein
MRAWCLSAPPPHATLRSLRDPFNHLKETTSPWMITALYNQVPNKTHHLHHLLHQVKRGAAGRRWLKSFRMCWELSLQELNCNLSSLKNKIVSLMLMMNLLLRISTSQDRFKSYLTNWMSKANSHHRSLRVTINHNNNL